MSYIRGGIRKSIWSRYPPKIDFKKKHRKRIINPSTGREVWGGTCYICGEDFPEKYLQVDHFKGEHQLKTIKDTSSFLEELLYLSEDDMGLCCVACHKSKTEAERRGISFEEAKIKLAVNKFMRDNKSKLETILKKFGKPFNNDAVRKQSIKELMEEGKLK